MHPKQRGLRRAIGVMAMKAPAGRRAERRKLGLAGGQPVEIAITQFVRLERFMGHRAADAFKNGAAPVRKTFFGRIEHLQEASAHAPVGGGCERRAYAADLSKE